MSQAGKEQVRRPAARTALALAVGLLAAAVIGLEVRMATGYPPGVRPRPFGELLGQRVPMVELPDRQGRSVQLWAEGEPRLLVFVRPACGACEAMYESLPGLGRLMPTVVVSSGGVSEALLKVAAVGPTVVGDSASTAAQAFGVTGVPSAVVVARGGRVADGAVGAGGIESMVRRSREGRR